MKEIPLTQEKVALVDDEDFEQLSQFKWYAIRMGRLIYAAHQQRVFSGYSGQRLLLMHSQILKRHSNAVEVDHIDGNGLNNIRSNLRLVTRRQNCQNYHITKTSRFPGVSWDKTYGRWQSHVWFGQTHIALGRFDTEEEAYSEYVGAIASNDGIDIE